MLLPIRPLNAARPSLQADSAEQGGLGVERVTFAAGTQGEMPRRDALSTHVHRPGLVQPDAKQISRPEQPFAAHLAQIPPLYHPVLTYHSLRAWRDAPKLTKTERDARGVVTEKIVQAAKPRSVDSGWQHEPLEVCGDLHLFGCAGLTQLPEGLRIEGSLRLDDCAELAQFPQDISIGGDLNLSRCTALTELCERLHINRNLSLSGCRNLRRLPYYCTVVGDLDLFGCTELTQLPPNLSVGGNLDSFNCVGLRQPSEVCATQLNFGVPHGRDGAPPAGSTSDANDAAWPPDPYANPPAEGLEIGGNLDLFDCTALTQLPRGLRVGHDVDLHNCPSLSRLPEGLHVGGHLNLSRCLSLTLLAGGLRVGGSLDLYGCIALRQLCDGLDVGGDLILFGCTSLTQLPAALTVGGALDLARCVNLRGLPEDLHVGGTLNLNDCSNLSQVPDGVGIAGSVSFARCSSLAQLPDEFCVDGDLDLFGCTSLMQLPEGLRVTGNLCLAGCTGLIKLPNRWSVGGNLDLSNCTRLLSLSDSFSIAGDLVLSGCTSLTALPDVLRVGGNVDLSGCTQLRGLPQTLSVGGGLRLRGCTGLTLLPEGIQLGGNLDLTNCVQLTHLPHDVGLWGALADGNHRTIELTGSAISINARMRMQQAQTSRMPFEFDMLCAPSASARFASLAQAAHFWQSEADCHFKWDVPNFAPWTLLPQQSALLAEFLARLCGSADYQHCKARTRLAGRVGELLHAMDQSAALRCLCCEAITDALHSCDDRVVWTMNQLESAVRLHHAQTASDDGAALKQLLLGSMKLDIVHKHARKKVASLSWVDEIEVFLAYECGLRRALQLPVSAEHMLFASCAQVTPEDLAKAQRAAQTSVADPVRVATYLQASAPWQRHLREQAAGRWSYAGTQQVPLPTDVQLEQLYCPFTLEPLSQLVQPIMWQTANACVVYESQKLLKYWIEQGNEPTSRQPMQLAQLRRPQLKAFAQMTAAPDRASLFGG